MIPDDVITQIREAADIVAVIGQHVQLRKAGRNWKGLCPFHGEKTASFNVSPDKGFFHCFGCQKHGDVFTFVMELEGRSFVEAAEQLAGRFNIVVPRIEENPELRKARGERVAMLDLNKVAATFYREVLADPVKGEPGRAYLAKRGVSQATADAFQLGYAPQEWSALADHLKAQRADLELALKVGLVGARSSGGYYDRNRARLVCPVIVPGGDVVGFSSRVVESPGPDVTDPPPKYINSPESSVYKKSKLLFGLAQAREGMATSKRCVLVEGNFDVITLHQAGFTEVVAPLGTALTPDQVNSLRRMAERVVLLYDGDRAGYKATMHALGLCIEAGVEVLVASRPGNARSGGAGPLADGVDPDSLVAGGGALQLQEAILRARGGAEFMAFEVWSKAKTSEQKARALDDAARLLQKFPTQTQRDLIVDVLAKALQVDVRVVAGAVARSRGGGPGPGSGSGSGPFGGGGNERPEEPRQAFRSTGPFIADEIEVISVLSDHPRLLATADAHKAFCLLTDARLRDMYSAARAGQSFVELATSTLPTELAKQVLSGKYVTNANPAAQLATMVRNLEHRSAGLERAQASKKLARSHNDGDQDVARLMAQLGIAKRLGDHEQITRLEEALASATGSSQGKQVD